MDTAHTESHVHYHAHGHADMTSRGYTLEVNMFINLSPSKLPMWGDLCTLAWSVYLGLACIRAWWATLVGSELPYTSREPTLI